MNTSSNEHWEKWQNYKGFEQRAYRFTAEMLPLFFKWLGINEHSRILDAGCGTGVFGRYLAGGLTDGQITGFDINEGFIEHGKERLKELFLSDKVTLELADGFNLHYADNTFDAVTNYTYIGVLSDPIAGMRELVRVCKQSGTVSCVIATNAFPVIWWQGDYPFNGAYELQRLYRLENDILSKYVQKDLSKNLSQNIDWHALRYPKMFELCGLKHINIHPYAYTFNYNDENIPLEYRKNLLYDETNEEINWLTSRYEENKKLYNEHGFYDADFTQLIGLLEIKLEYIKNNFENDKSFEWRGGFNFIVTGLKV
ncbi:MAG: class I SAM-dependent methyltransferase [Oscillospiraceae bacterium]|nr:class I SAM-dependent methyltransferase [Oscillospiraceae bacterium]